MLGRRGGEFPSHKIEGPPFAAKATDLDALRTAVVDAAGVGYGGQRLFVLPELDIVVAMTAGNYADKDQWIPPIRVMREAVLPSVV